LTCVFRRKYNTDGSLQTFKAKLESKVSKQKEGIDYFYTYVLVARIASIRVLMALEGFVMPRNEKVVFLKGDG
jgi:hypothetical protein